MWRFSQFYFLKHESLPSSYFYLNFIGTQLYRTESRALWVKEGVVGFGTSFLWRWLLGFCLLLNSRASQNSLETKH